MNGSWIFIGEEFFEEEERSFLELCCSRYTGHEVKGIFAKVLRKDMGIFEKLLKLRFAPESYRIPCWIWGEWVMPFVSFLWPRNPEDRISLTFDSFSCERWMEKIWNRSTVGPNFNRSHEGRLKDISSFELLLLLDFNKASGILDAVRSDGVDARFKIDKGYLCQAYSRGIIGVDALYDFISWNEGVYVWETNPRSMPHNYNVDPSVPLSQLIGDYYMLLKDNVHIFEIINSFNTLIELKPSHCALDDPADPFFEDYAKICNILSKQQMSIDSLVQLSTVSPVRTILFVNRIISLGDAVPVKSEEPDHSYIARIDGVSDVLPSDQDRQYRVLVVDDAPFFLKVITRMIENDRRFHVVATARDGIECLEALEKYDPDIITLDLEMPRLDGLSALKRIMIQHPKPVVVLSAFTGESSRMTYDAFKFGAVDVIEKPKNFSLQDMEQNTRVILDRLFRAANIQLEEIRYLRRTASKNYSQAFFSSAVDERNKIFINVFGTGSFSHFIKVLFLLDSIELDAPVILLAPIRYEPLKELISYIRSDCEKPVELVTEVPVELYRGWFYICPQDIFSSISVSDNRIVISLESGKGVSSLSSEGEILLNLVNSFWEAFGDRVVVSCISGGEENVEALEQCIRKGMTLFYLNPSRCLYPGLSIKLRERKVGVEVDGIEQLVESWQKIAAIN